MGGSKRTIVRSKSSIGRKAACTTTGPNLSLLAERHQGRILRQCCKALTSPCQSFAGWRICARRSRHLCIDGPRNWKVSDTRIAMHAFSIGAQFVVLFGEWSSQRPIILLLWSFSCGESANCSRDRPAICDWSRWQLRSNVRPRSRVCVAKAEAPNFEALGRLWSLPAACHRLSGPGSDPGQGLWSVQRSYCHVLAQSRCSAVSAALRSTHPLSPVVFCTRLYSTAVVAHASEFPRGLDTCCSRWPPKSRRASILQLSNLFR